MHLILGNRDLNKLRLATELSSAAIADPAVVADTSHPAWVPQEQRVPYESFLQARGGPQHNTLPNRCTPLASPASCSDSAGLRTKRHGDSARAVRSWIRGL